jgi:hypothetical protein
MTSVVGLPVGNAIGFETGVGGRLEARTINSNALTRITPKHGFSNAPANGALCLPSATYYLGGTSGNQTTYLQTFIEGLNTADRYVLLGGWCTSFKISNIGPARPPGSIPQVAFTFRFADWLKADDASNAGALTGALGRATYSDNVQLPVKDSEFYYQNNSSATIGDLIRAPVIEFNPVIAYATHEAPDGVNTIVQPLRVGPDNQQPLSISFTVPLEEHTWREHLEGEDAFGFWYQIGSNAERGCAMLEGPTCQVVDVQDEPGAITSVKVMVEGGEDAQIVTTGLTGTNLDRALSPFRLHLL